MTTVGLGLEEVIAGELKEIDASVGECFLDVCCLLECVNVNRKVNLRRREKIGNKSIERTHSNAGDRMLWFNG